MIAPSTVLNWVSGLRHVPCVWFDGWHDEATWINVWKLIRLPPAQPNNISSARESPSLSLKVNDRWGCSSLSRIPYSFHRFSSEMLWLLRHGTRPPPSAQRDSWSGLVRSGVLARETGFSVFLACDLDTGHYCLLRKLHDHPRSLSQSQTNSACCSRIS